MAAGNGAIRERLHPIVGFAVRLTGGVARGLGEAGLQPVTRPLWHGAARTRPGQRRFSILLVDDTRFVSTLARNKHRARWAILDSNQ